MSAAAATAAPMALSVDASGIPVDLKALPQWVGWTYEYRKDGWTKPPISPATGKYAASTDPHTWATFADALRFARSRALPGIGVNVARTDPYVGIDLDKCRDPETGAIEPWARAVIDRFASYTEVSPSGRGGPHRDPHGLRPLAEWQGRAAQGTDRGLRRGSLLHHDGPPFERDP
jgi:hypothetical protein